MVNESWSCGTCCESLEKETRHHPPKTVPNCFSSGSRGNFLQKLWVCVSHLSFFVGWENKNNTWMSMEVIVTIVSKLGYFTYLKGRITTYLYRGEITQLLSTSTSRTSQYTWGILKQCFVVFRMLFCGSLRSFKAFQMSHRSQEVLEMLSTDRVKLFEMSDSFPSHIAMESKWLIISELICWQLTISFSQGHVWWDTDSFRTKGTSGGSDLLCTYFSPNGEFFYDRLFSDSECSLKWGGNPQSFG